MRRINMNRAHGEPRSWWLEGGSWQEIESRQSSAATGQPPWTQGSEGRDLMLWSQIQITEEEDEAKWSSR